MVFALFRVFGPDFLADDFVAQFSLEDVDIWSKGQSRRSGRPHKDAGFSISLQDAQTTLEAIPIIESFLDKNQRWLTALDKQPVECLLHLGVTVGEVSSFAPCLEFPPPFLALLVRLKIALHVSAYPANDSE